MNTLEYHQKRPLTIMRPMGWAPAQNVAKSLKPLMTIYEKTHVRPEHTALQFYLWQHALGHIRTTYAPTAPLPADVLGLVNAYHAEVVDSVQRMFLYLTLICTREARHANFSSGLDSAIIASFGGAVASFQTSMPSASGAAAKRFIQAPPAASFGMYCSAMRMNFFYPGAYHGGYGGPKWGAIATVLEKFVLGEYSAEMMLDTSFHLSHNNGPIFNKGLGFKMYDHHEIMKILNAQAAGQIPKLIESGTVSSEYCPSWISAQLKRIRSVIGDEPLFGEKLKTTAQKKQKKFTQHGSKIGAKALLSGKNSFSIGAAPGPKFVPYSKDQENVIPKGSTITKAVIEIDKPGYPSEVGEPF